MKSMGDWGRSNLYMIPRKRNVSTLNLGFDPRYHTIRLTQEEIDSFKKVMISVQVCDPSYSTLNKKDGDDKSRFTIIHLLMSNDTIFIYDIYSTKGERNDPTIKLNTLRALENQTDVFIMDAQGTQMSLFKDVSESIKKQLGSITTIPYTKKSVSLGQGKIEIANNVLRSYFIEEKIKVIITPENSERIQLVIDQLAGVDPGLDVIDCIVYAKESVNTQEELRLAQYRKKQGIDDVAQCTKVWGEQSDYFNAVDNSYGAEQCLK